MKYTNEQLEAISKEAFEAASSAATKYLNDHGEPLYCGFAWVNIKPGNSQIANYLKKNKLGRPSYSGGVDVWNPSNNMTQSMIVKEVGADAFAAVLQKYGFNAYMDCRAD